MTFQTEPTRIPPRSGRAFELPSGAMLTIACPDIPQVADLIAFNASDLRDQFSAGRTADYEGSVRLTTGSTLWSNRSTPLLRIAEDTVGVHDILLPPCSQEMFERLHGTTGPHPSCFANLREALSVYGIDGDRIDATFNVFMDVRVELDGQVSVLPPAANAGDFVTFEALIDLLIGVTACSAEQTNGGRFGPIDVKFAHR